MLASPRLYLVIFSQIYVTNFRIVNFLSPELIIGRMNDESLRVRLHVRFKSPIPYCVFVSISLPSPLRPVL
jgi:hypothetical protein